MEAIEYLEQVRRIDAQMRIIQAQINNIVELSGLNYDKIPAQTIGGSKTERLAMYRVELLNEYEEKRNELTSARLEVVSTILTLKGRYKVEVMFKRYIELKRWRKIARELHLSESMVFKVHSAAIQDVDKMLKDYSKLQ